MSVEDILSEMARNAGRVQLQRGQILGDVVNSAAQIPGQFYADKARQALQARQQSFQDAELARQTEDQQFKRDDRAHQAEQDAANEAKRRRDEESKQVLSDAISAGFGKSNNPKDFDVEAATKYAKENGHPEHVQAIAAAHKSFAPEAKTREIDTIDAMGNPVKKIVPDVAGSEYPVAVKPEKLTYGQPIPALLNGKRDLIRSGSDGKTYDMRGNSVGDEVKIEPDPRANNVINLNNDQKNDVRDAVAFMKEGKAPPLLPGRATKEYLATIAEAKRQDYDIATAASDWTATQKHIATMNGAQQLRLNQSVNALPELLDSVDELASQWKGGKFPLLNKGSLALAKGGAYGPEAASIANKLETQIADTVADLGTVYMGGNSPTDHALELAGKGLKSDWDEKVLHDLVSNARKNVTIRQNSIKNTGVAGASDSNPYGGQPPVVAQPPVMTPKPKLSAAELIKKYGG